jgi:hypothetical protein
MRDDVKALGLQILRVTRVAAVVACALPGIVWTIITLVFLISRNPFPDAGRNLWEVVTLVDYFTMLVSPILVVMIWLLRWRPSSLSQPGRSIATIVGIWGTLGALLFWVRLLT